MKIALPYLLVVMICGCTPVTTQEPATTQTARKSEKQPGITQITCKPKFELKRRPEIHVTDSEGNQRDAFRQWLILDDGKQKFRILWGSPPLSRGPVTLYTHQTYTFTVKMETKAETQIPKVIRAKKEAEIIYEAQE